MKYLIIPVVLALLLYTRFINLSWGLPYPFHPDERNMAVAIQNFTCHDLQGANLDLRTIVQCLNPKFFAYGQLSLYLAYGLIRTMQWFTGAYSQPSFTETVFALRIVSASASVVTVLYLLKITDFLLYAIKDKNEFAHSSFKRLIGSLIFIFSPALIQFSHFGTTESLLILFYSALLYYSLKVLQNSEYIQKYLIISGVICGLAAATKISSLVYCFIPAYCLLHDTKRIENIFSRIVFRIVALARFTTIVLFFGIILSPFNLIKFEEFYNSFEYESSVALGKVSVFYTRQFFNTPPVFFQFDTIFPYALGYAVFILAAAGFLFLPWRNRYINFLRISFIIVFVPNAYVYAKWSRFIGPAYPVLLIISVVYLFYFFQNIKNRLSKIKWYKIQNSDNNILSSLVFITTIFCIIPGIAFLSIYRNQDVRFTASEWIYKNIPTGSYILTETANVVDIPIHSPEMLKNNAIEENKQFTQKSFNYYDLDTESSLQEELIREIGIADYIFVPSRRIFANHTCYEIAGTEIMLQQNFDEQCIYRLQKYPLLNKHYEELFTGKSGFIKTAEFASYPKIQIFGITIAEFPDENAEETWTVFDHPVIRIYKKSS